MCPNANLQRSFVLVVLSKLGSHREKSIQQQLGKWERERNGGQEETIREVNWTQTPRDNHIRSINEKMQALM